MLVENLLEYGSQLMVELNWSRAFDGTDAQETTGYKEFSSLDIDSNNRIWGGTRMNSYWSGGGEIFYSDDGATWTEANWKIFYSWNT